MISIDLSHLFCQVDLCHLFCLADPSLVVLMEEEVIYQLVLELMKQLLFSENINVD